MLSGSAPSFATANRAIGAVSGSQKLTIQVWLKQRTAAAESFATAVSTPGSAQYGHFLSPAAYEARFGATGAQAGSVASWLRSAGFAGVRTDSGRDYVEATATVSAINAAFHVRMTYYRASGQVNAGPYALRSNDRSISLPSSVAANVVGVTGLDNASPVMTYIKPGVPARAKLLPPPSPAPKPIAFPCSQFYAQHYASNLPKKFGVTKFPTEVCGYNANEIRRAYGYNRHNIGKGVTVALIELGLAPDMFQTLADYAAFNRVQSPSTSRYSELSLGLGSACGDPFYGEEQLDVESAYDMAPLANELVVGGDSCNNGNYGLQGLFDADTAILNGVGGHPLAQIASNSWGIGGEQLPPALVNIPHAYLVRAAAEGVSMLFSSGDGSGVAYPASDPWATAVGGTTLAIGNRDPYEFETGWSTDISISLDNKHWIDEGEQGAAGGGPSLLWAQPAYQRGVVPNFLARAPGNRPGLIRAVPDIGADADPFTGFAVGLLIFNNKGVPTGFTETDIGGTSLASPLVAGLVADSEQYQRPFGFLNPALYKLSGTNAINNVGPITAATPTRYRGVACDQAACGILAITQFDDQSFNMLFYTGQVARAGYGTMAGIGTPHGQNFVYALRKLA